KTIRGSTSRGGAKALVEIARTLGRGIEVAITPDGPRGPVHTIAPGVVYAARRANVPVIPIGVRASNAWRLNTWDRFMIPKPFARITIEYGDEFVARADEAGGDIDKDSERLGAAFRALEAVRA
ncbi:MAG TPA: DUF374 domain-containing protein, partial [Gemmatimonadaceae bacterium]|nr:DUF374 domain-containing protein [Gemmatimonadaceae bacterium]